MCMRIRRGSVVLTKAKCICLKFNKVFTAFWLYIGCASRDIKSDARENEHFYHADLFKWDWMGQNYSFIDVWEHIITRPIAHFNCLRRGSQDWNPKYPKSMQKYAYTKKMKREAIYKQGT